MQSGVIILRRVRKSFNTLNLQNGDTVPDSGSRHIIIVFLAPWSMTKKNVI
jgi:hypothetical protein